MRVRAAIIALAGAGLLAGCASVVSGSGATAPSSAPGGHDFPSPSGSAAPGTAVVPVPSQSGSAPGSSGPGSSRVSPPTRCPRVSYPYAHLAFDCITAGMTQNLGGQVWPLAESKPVASGGDWVLEEGAGHWGPANGESLAAIAANVRQQMLDAGGYGQNPTAHTDEDTDTKVDGAPAHLLQTTMTINPAWARANNVTVKQEKLWIIAIRVGTNDVSLWYTSLPDLARALWPKVPAIIATIKVI